MSFELFTRVDHVAVALRKASISCIYIIRIFKFYFGFYYYYYCYNLDFQQRLLYRYELGPMLRKRYQILIERRNYKTSISPNIFCSMTEIYTRLEFIVVHPHYLDSSWFGSTFIGNTNLSNLVNADFILVEYDLNFVHGSIITKKKKTQQI